jgi:hypothetical protein
MQKKKKFRIEGNSNKVTGAWGSVVVKVLR